MAKRRRAKNNGHTGAANKGTRLAVDPLREPKDVAAIVDHLEGKTKYKTLWIVAVNNGLRMVDILGLNAGQMRKGLEQYRRNANHKNPAKRAGVVWITETKTGKKNMVCIGAGTAGALEEYFAEYPNRTGDDPMFFSQKNPAKRLTQQQAGDLVKQWTEAVGVNGGRYGCHTPRKTWGYNARMNGVPLVNIMRRFNHGDPEVTLRYLGFTDDETLETLACNEII